MTRRAWILPLVLILGGAGIVVALGGILSLQTMAPRDSLTAATAAEINLRITDFDEAGWAKDYERPVSEQLAGVLDGHFIRFRNAASYGAIVIESTVFRFDSIPSASAHFDGLVASIRANYSTETPRLGAGAIYYERSVEVRHLLFWAKNVVTHLEVIVLGRLFFQFQLLALGKGIEARI